MGFAEWALAAVGAAKTDANAWRRTRCNPIPILGFDKALVAVSSHPEVQPGAVCAKRAGESRHR